MGADFIIDYVDLLDGEPDTLAAMYILIYEKINHMSEDDFRGYIADHTGEKPDPEELTEDATGLLASELYDMARELHDASQSPYNREGTIITVPRSYWHGKPTKILTTGGMSGGDSPTELYNTMQGLYEAAILPLTYEEQGRILDLVLSSRESKEAEARELRLALSSEKRDDLNGAT